jgi:hypothetical protein
MYLFAHVFLGALIGIGFWCVTRDRWVLPFCIVGALLPDLLDKPLALLFPDILGNSKTIGHTLILFFTVITVAGVLLWHQQRRTLLGLAFACGVLSHQILDAMWNLAEIWFFPLLGPFPVSSISGKIWWYPLWLELSSPSEWVFALASAFLITAWYSEIVEDRLPLLSPAHKKNTLLIVAACILGGMGIYLLVA